MLKDDNAEPDNVESVVGNNLIVASHVGVHCIRSTYFCLNI